MSARLTQIRDSIWRRLRRGKEELGIEGDSMRSVVLLQREGRFLGREEVESRAEKGWSCKFDGKQDSMYFVVQSEQVTMIKAGKLVINFLQARRPYLGNPDEVAIQLLREEQQQAWRQHRAWMSFDLINEEIDRRDAYCALAKFALGFGDENCVGVYLPGERMFAPNSSGEAEEMLRFLIRKEIQL